MTTGVPARAAAVVLLVGLVACGAPVAPAAGPDPTPRFRPPPDPVAACASQLEHWAGEQLSGGPDRGYDYQHMGLTSGQADALVRIVEQARAEDPSIVRAAAREACAALAAGPSTAPWGT